MFTLRLENESGNIVNINDGIAYEVLSVSGLNPPSASLFTRKSPNKKGSKYNGSTLDERFVLIDIKLLGDVEENRNALYPWSESEQYVKIYYSNGVKSIYCEGYVTDCDVNPFTENEVVTISVTCADPYLKELQAIETEISNYQKDFSFPFSISVGEVVAYPSPNEDGTDAVAYRNEGIPISSILDNNATKILNVGAETGVFISILCNAPVNNITIYDGNDFNKNLTLKYEFASNTIIEIDTEASPKTVRAKMPDGTTVNMMKYLEPNPHWFTLKKGYNSIGHYSDSPTSTYSVTVSFRNKHLGI